ncbi:MAG TPA: tRNA (adenosine(37)-N6)-threonylcarbamoyltransferase complex dimerization subunit type 1 TsaB [Steroidobacteraceae bacterium]|jgi:tRNA threonylcarbamoyladenosine biosynthesis protein TsaB|nr:tRNA (adenosine(37)-N6)-threonylcarbamoyltransferase complex dimerization subunit type 1 TsaB [Steroidobacteraceae bacterium]
MRILAVDAATERCSVALLSGEELTGRVAERGPAHAEQILDMVDGVLAEAGVALSMLDGIAASIGPGAFTGIRISVAVAQGLAFGADLPVIPVTTLEALAYQSMQSGAAHALACLDARMGEVYWGCFAADPLKGLVATSAARVGTPDSVVLPAAALTAVARTAGVVYRGIGRGFAAYPALAALPGLHLTPRDREALPDAREFAVLGARRLRNGEGRDPADLSPLYLRDKVALTEAERGVK